MIKKAVAILILVIIIFFSAIYYFCPHVYDNAKKISTHIFHQNNKQFYVWQTIAPDTNSDRTISWLGRKGGQGQLELSYEGHYTITYVATTTAFDTKSDVYTVKLTSLDANTDYQYRISVNNGQSDWYAFSTGSTDKSTCSVIIFGDSRSFNPAVWQSTASTAYNANPQIDFFVNMGNLVDNGSNFNQWRRWLAGIASFSPFVPVAPVIGSHEVINVNWQADKPRDFQSLFNIPQNSSYAIQRHAYSFDSGSVHFVVLDTQFAQQEAFLSSLMLDEICWLDEDLAQTQLPWKIILMYQSPWQDEPSTTSLNEFGEMLQPILAKYSVDMVISGSLGAYLRTTENSPKPVYISAGRSGDIVDESLPNVSGHFFNPTVPMYLKLDANTHSLSITAYQTDGQIIDRWQADNK